MRNEPVHVYQNRIPHYHVSTMIYCPVCNGYYGVPHHGCLERGGCGAVANSCACRKHMSERGELRQGKHGWIIGGRSI